MIQSLRWRHPVFRIPTNTSMQKIKEFFIIWFYHWFEGLWAWHPWFTFFRLIGNHLSLFISEIALPFCSVKHFFWRTSEKLLHHWQLVFFVFSWEKRKPSEQLNQDQARASHIDRHCVITAQNNLWSSIEAWLDVGVELVIQEASRAKIDHFNPWFIILL